MTARRGLAVMALGVTLLAACGSSPEDQGGSRSSSGSAPPGETMAPGHSMPGRGMPGNTVPDGSMDQASIDPANRAAALLATASFQDVETAEAAGYSSSLDSLGCFQDPDQGGMGVHYIDQSLMDATVDITKPEALVYELDAHGHIAGLVAHEYIVPIEAWTSDQPPTLFGMAFHRHPTLPLWVLHAWIWKDNPTGVFQDWNPAVRLCPDGVPIFGVDLGPGSGQDPPSGAPAPGTSAPAIAIGGDARSGPR